MPPPGQRRLRRPRPSPSLWASGGGQRKPLPLRTRCRRAALESETSKRDRIGARCGYSGFLGLPSLSVVQNRSVPVSSLAQKPKPWQSHLLSPPFPAHSAASGTIFQVVLKNSFLQVCASAARAERSRGATLRGLRGQLGADRPVSRAGGLPALVGLSAPLPGRARGVPSRSYCSA